MEFINEFHYNVMAKKYQDWYQRLSDEHREQVDHIPDLPQEQFRMKYIKRVRKPDIKAGTIFAMKLPEEIYLYGKIISSANHLPFISEPDPYYVAMVYQTATQELLNPHYFELDDTDCIIGPWIVPERLWRNGTFYTVGEKELTEKEQNLDVGFYSTHGYIDENDRYQQIGMIYDLNGNLATHEPKYLALGGYKTIYGIEYDIRVEMIQERIILNESNT